MPEATIDKKSQTTKKQNKTKINKQKKTKQLQFM